MDIGDPLPDNWQWGVINDIKDPSCHSIVSGPFGSNIGSRFFVDMGIPVIRGNNLTEDFTRFVDSGFVFITEDKADELKSCEAIRDDIIITAAGSLGQVGIISKNSRFPKYIISNKQLRARLDKSKVDPIFAFYWLSSPLMVEYIKQRNTGSSVPLINLSILRELPIPLPPLPTQHAIARILGSLDDKIELNRQMNETLEAMARAIFQSWFVDFDPVRAKAEGRDNGLLPEVAALFPSEIVEADGREMPKGWGVEPLDKIAIFLNGLALQNYPAESDNAFLPVIKIAQMHKGGSEGSDKASVEIPPEYIVKDGDVLFSWSGSLEVILWCGGRGALNQHLFKVSSEICPKWFYYYWTLHHLFDFQLIAEGKATTMGHIQRHHLSEAMVIVPPSDLMERMDKVMAPLVNKIITNAIESHTLAQIRDALLPKLMSGELKVG